MSSAYLQLSDLHMSFERNGKTNQVLKGVSSMFNRASSSH